MTEPAGVVLYEERDGVAFVTLSEVIRERHRPWADYGERPR